MRQSFFSIFSGAGKFCLAHGLRQLKHEVKKKDVRILNFISDVTTKNKVVMQHKLSKKEDMSNDK